MSNSPHQSTTVWKVLHGAPPTPPPARRDPDRHPQPNAGQQQKAAIAAGLHSAPASPGSYLQQQQQQYQQQQTLQGLSSSAVSLQLSPSLHGTLRHQQNMHQHSSSLDDATFLHYAHQGDTQLQQQQQMQQQSPSKQAWPNLSSPKQGQSPASSPWGKLPAVATASSPDPDLRNQVCLLASSTCSCIHSTAIHTHLTAKCSLATARFAGVQCF